jgi:FlaA1/EpsC-like NDP-sugar epimerase
MIRRSGLKPDEDIAIQFTGIRPGEKLSEELAGQNEKTMPTSHAKIRIWQLPPATAGQSRMMIERLGASVNQGREAILAALRASVPEYQPDGEGVTVRLHPETAAARAA